MKDRLSKPERCNETDGIGIGLALLHDQWQAYYDQEMQREKEHIETKDMQIRMLLDKVKQLEQHLKQEASDFDTLEVRCQELEAKILQQESRDVSRSDIAEKVYHFGQLTTGYLDKSHLLAGDYTFISSMQYNDFITAIYNLINGDKQ